MDLENTTFSDDVLFESKCNYTSMDDTLLSTTKNKSLKDYDRELKQLKEENFSLKLRIYMLEEEKSERDDKKSSETPKAAEAITRCDKCFCHKETRRGQEFAASSSTLSSSLSEPESQSTASAVAEEATHEEAAANSHHHQRQQQSQQSDRRHRRRQRRRQRQRTKSSDNNNFYATDDEQKEIELENLNQINLDLERAIDTLRSDLNKKIQLIEENKKERENLEIKFAQFQIECERELHDRLKERFEAELNEKLDQAYQIAFIRERELRSKLNECEHRLSELIDLIERKQNEIERLKYENSQFVNEYKSAAANHMMENLIAKDSIIEQLRAQLGYQVSVKVKYRSSDATTTTTNISQVKETVKNEADDNDDGDEKKKFNYHFSTVYMYPCIEKSMKVYELKNSSLDDDEANNNQTTT